jgi:hypothetical protein
MNQLLKNKLESWSYQLVLQNNNYIPIAPDAEDTRIDLRFDEKDSDGIYNIGQRTALYYKNDGTIECVTNSNYIDTSNDFAMLTGLYNISLSGGGVRVSQPLDYEVDGDFVSIVHKCPTENMGENLGLHYLDNFTTVDRAWFDEVILQFAGLIKALEQIMPVGNLYPLRCSVANVFKDDVGYYFTALSGFNVDKATFIGLKLTELSKWSDEFYLTHGINKADFLEFVEQTWNQ